MQRTSLRRALLLAGLSTVLAAAWPVTAAAESVAWTRQFGTAGLDSAQYVAGDETSLFVAGLTRGSLYAPHQGWDDIFLIVQDLTGRRLWAKQLGSNLGDFPRALAVDRAGYTAAVTMSGEHSLLRYDRAGRLLWSQPLPSVRVDSRPFFLAADGLGITVAASVSGSLAGPSRGGADGWIRRYRRDGSVAWTWQFGTADDDQVTAVRADGAGINVAGYSYRRSPSEGVPSRREWFYRRYTYSGTTQSVLWFGAERLEGGAGALEHILSVTLDGGGLNVLGVPYDHPAQTHLRRYTLNGHLEWKLRTQYIAAERFPPPSIHSDGRTIAVVGLDHYTPETSVNGGVQAVSVTGRHLWHDSVGRSDSYELAHGVAVRGGGVTAVGYTSGIVAGGVHYGGRRDAWVRRYEQ